MVLTYNTSYRFARFQISSSVQDQLETGLGHRTGCGDGGRLLERDVRHGPFHSQGLRPAPDASPDQHQATSRQQRRQYLQNGKNIVSSA